ncbi:hypothetical protein D3878_10770 [Noviherbaspirillum sedimenti]|uniref:Uracil-DNA glycosylase-like domain-containing protein n=2 Tax=Noviherbaspirillum sedimenti TaxID=2320865 RepID=A0A3A3G239_9BURK|nr:hypothetical protein D3878_10770 [Noviherbaspirillum sedimenti]
MRDPQNAKVFIIGKNQATPFTIEKVGSHERHIDALFNRNGETCDELYHAVRDGKSSRSRPVIETLTTRLAQQGIHEVLETNVICYSTPMSRDLAQEVHAGGTKRGEEIFHTLLKVIQPPILIAHGQSVRTALEQSLGQPLPRLPENPTSDVVSTELHFGNYRPVVMVIPSLAMPQANKWASWRPAHLDSLAEKVARVLDAF